MEKSQITRLYNENFERIYKFFYYKFLSKEKAEDLTSETFLTFINLIKKKDIDTINKPESYIYGIAKIIFIKELKLKYKNEKFEEKRDFDFITENYIQTFSEEIEKKTSNEEKVKQYIDKLPKKQAEIINLRLIEKLTIKEISQKINKPSSYIKTTQNRAIKGLRKLISKEE